MWLLDEREKGREVGVMMVTYEFWYACRMNEAAMMIEKIAGAILLGLYA